jgi:hypothetical protein
VASGSLHNLNLSYDITQCALVEQKPQGQEVRQCVFQLIAEPGSVMPYWEYSLQVERKYHISYLREGKLTKEYLSK